MFNNCMDLCVHWGSMYPSMVLIVTSLWFIMQYFASTWGTSVCELSHGVRIAPGFGKNHLDLTPRPALGLQLNTRGNDNHQNCGHQNQKKTLNLQLHCSGHVWTYCRQTDGFVFSISSQMRHQYFFLFYKEVHAIVTSWFVTPLNYTYLHLHLQWFLPP